MTKEIEYEGERIESGPIKFGSDWTGVFIRGDNALPTAMYLRELVRKYEAQVNEEDAILLAMVASHADLLESCVEGKNYYEDTI